MRERLKERRGSKMTRAVRRPHLWRVTYNGEDRPVLWGNLAAESNNSSSVALAEEDQTISNQTIKQFFVWDCTESVATRPLAWFNSAFDTSHSALYYTHDGNKNVSEVIAANCDLAAHYDYAPFGAVISQRGIFAATNPWRFSSEFADGELGLVYYNYRPYEVLTGRWLCRDFLSEDACANLYKFAQALYHFDVLGLPPDRCENCK